jgi:hypothetical protein
MLFVLPNALSKFAWLGFGLFAFRLCKPRLECLGTTTMSSSNFELNLLSFSKRIMVHSLKLATMEEKVFSFRSLDKTVSMVFY